MYFVRYDVRHDKLLGLQCYLNEHPRLVISVGAEPGCFLGGDGGAALDEGGHDTTARFDTQAGGVRGVVGGEVNYILLS